MKNDFPILTQPLKLGIVVHVCNTDTLEGVAEGLQIQGWPGNINLKVTCTVPKKQ